MCPSLARGISQAGNLLNKNKPSGVFLFLCARASAFGQFDHFSDQAHLMRAGGPRLALRTAARVNPRLVTVARHWGAGRSSGVARANIAPVPPLRPAGNVARSSFNLKLFIIVSSHPSRYSSPSRRQLMEQRCGLRVVAHVHAYLVNTSGKRKKKVKS